MLLAIIIVGLLISITLHEATHAFTSHWLGDDTAMREGRVTLNPLKHIDLFSTILLPILLVLSNLPPFAAAKPVPFNPNRVRYEEFGAALVGVSGPLSNLLIATFLGAWLKYVVGVDAGWASYVLAVMVYLNLSLFVFNMIPWPPLDGSRLFYAFAPDGVRRVMEQIESFGLMGIALFIFFLFNFLSPVVSNAVRGLFELIVGLPPNMII
jgi:Zn-dependent protease